MTVEAAERAVTRGAAIPWLLYVAVAAIAGLPVLLSLPFLGEPLGRDQAVYFTVAQSGNLPYVEVFDHKQPLIYGWYALAMFLNGGEPAVEAINLLAALQLSAAALAVAWVGLLLGGRRLALVAGLPMALTAANRYLQFDANTEVFMLPPLVLSLGVCIFGVQQGKTRWFWISGALCGLAITTKSVALLQLVAFVATLLWGAAMGQVSWSSARRWSGALVGGAALVVIAAALPFVFAGAFGDFWHANVTYNLRYGEQIPSFAKVFLFSQMDGRVVAGALPVWTLAIIGVFLSCRSFPRLPVALVIASGVGAFLGVASTGQQFPHYFVALTPFAALLAGVALIEMTRDWRQRRPRRLHVELLLVVLTLPALLALLPLYALDVDRVYEVTHVRLEARRAKADEDIAAYINSVTSEDAEVYVVGADTQVYVLSARRPAAYYARAAAFAIEPDTFDDTIGALEAEPPAVIADTSIVYAWEYDREGLVGYEDDLDEEQRARLQAFLNDRYEFDRQIAHAKIYLLKEADGGG